MAPTPPEDFAPSHTDARLDAIDLQLQRGAKRMDQLENAVEDNTALTTEIRDLIAAAKAGFRVLGWIGTGAKWAGAVASAIAAVYGLVLLIKGGK